MAMISKRIERLERATPRKTDRPVLKNLAELYEWIKTPEGQAEMEELYGTEEEQQQLMADYQEKLKQMGLP